jgi:hypothetical protein
MIFLYLAALAGGGQAESPRAFIQRIYAGYAKRSYNPLNRIDGIFAPPLAAAIREDARLAHGEVGYLDGDPLCDCQDYGRIRAEVRRLTRPTRQSAEAAVHVDLGIGEARDLRLRLVLTPKGWRVGDVGSADQPSLLKALQRANRKR